MESIYVHHACTMCCCCCTSAIIILKSDLHYYCAIYWMILGTLTQALNHSHRKFIGFFFMYNIWLCRFVILFYFLFYGFINYYNLTSAKWNYKNAMKNAPKNNCNARWIDIETLQIYSPSAPLPHAIHTISTESINYNFNFFFIGFSFLRFKNWLRLMKRLKYLKILFKY